jgi:hypothetical protein
MLVAAAAFAFVLDFARVPVFKRLGIISRTGGVLESLDQSFKLNIKRFGVRRRRRDFPVDAKSAKWCSRFPDVLQMKSVRDFLRAWVGYAGPLVRVQFGSSRQKPPSHIVPSPQIG